MYEDDYYYLSSYMNTPTPKRSRISGLQTPTKGMCISINGDFCQSSPEILNSSFNSPQTSAITSPFVYKKWSFREHEAELLEEDLKKNANHSHRKKNFKLLSLLLLFGILMLGHVAFLVPFLVTLFFYIKPMISNDSQPSRQCSRTPTPRQF